MERYFTYRGAPGFEQGLSISSSHILMPLHLLEEVEQQVEIIYTNDQIDFAIVKKESSTRNLNLLAVGCDPISMSYITNIGYNLAFKIKIVNRVSVLVEFSSANSLESGHSGTVVNALFTGLVQFTPEREVTNCPGPYIIIIATKWDNNRVGLGLFVPAISNTSLKAVEAIDWEIWKPIGNFSTQNRNRTLQRSYLQSIMNSNANDELELVPLKFSKGDASTKSYDDLRTNFQSNENFVATWKSERIAINSLNHWSDYDKLLFTKAKTTTNFDEATLLVAILKYSNLSSGTNGDCCWFLEYEKEHSPNKNTKNHLCGMLQEYFPDKSGNINKSQDDVILYCESTKPITISRTVWDGFCVKSPATTLCHHPILCERNPECKGGPKKISHACFRPSHLVYAPKGFNTLCTAFGQCDLDLSACNQMNFKW